MNKSYLATALGIAVLVTSFQNCSGTSFNPGNQTVQAMGSGDSGPGAILPGAILPSESGASVAPPVPEKDPNDVAGTVVIPNSSACAGSDAVQKINVATLSTNFTAADASLVFAQGHLLGTGTAYGVYAQRFSLESLDTSQVLYDPGASYSPNVGGNGILAALAGYVPAGKFQLAITPEGNPANVSDTILASIYPLCGNSKVIWYRSKADLGSPTSGTPMSYDVALSQDATVIIASEKTAYYVPNHLQISVSVLNLDTNQPVACPMTGTTNWVYPFPSTPSVSGYCQVSLPVGHYRISNVISSDAANLNGTTQHLGILALKPEAL